MHRWLFVLRVVLGAIFIYHGTTKLAPWAAEMMAGFVGGAFHNIGLTFISQAMWVTVLGVIETAAWVLLILGLLTRTVAVAVIIVMLGAMDAKGRGWPNIEMDIILASIWLALVIAGPSKKSLDAYRCKDSYNECDCSCNHTPQATPTHQKDVNINTKTTGKKVVEHEVYEA